MIVPGDADLTAMSPWRSRPIIEPGKFAALVDASRRARRRRQGSEEGSSPTAAS